MAYEETLSGKKILVVDDEQDVLDIVKEKLSSCILTTATGFNTAREYLEKEHFDLAILDIMGVRGFDLLHYAREKNIRAVMLTAHSMNAESMQRSIDRGAVSFLPKDEMYRLDELVAEIFGDLAQSKAHWPKLEKRLQRKLRKEWGELWDRIRFPREPEID